MPTDALQLQAINTYYADSRALHDVSLTLQSGEVLVLLGRNGAGKTTTMHSIIGFTPPRDGEVLLFGESLRGLPPEVVARRGVGLVPQGRRIFRSLSVMENLRVAERPGPQGKASWDVARVFDLFPRLRERKAQAAGSMSGGEQQMLAIARALMGNPRVVLFDEPSEGLAPQIVEEVGDILRRLKTEGLSIILVEQNTRFALALADHVAILNTGRVVFDGTPAALAADPNLIAANLGVH
ncbi:ABC transporter ATP-binding protein [Ferrovibrio sp.]|uniref:ABC transporter ATP-binding protein n=1 Tax=Ferrovibrio sp. TaxID=1917215 RepID=UPI003D1215C3